MTARLARSHVKSVEMKYVHLNMNGGEAGMTMPVVSCSDFHLVVVTGATLERDKVRRGVFLGLRGRRARWRHGLRNRFGEMWR
jgi:hypothetical protein